MVAFPLRDLANSVGEIEGLPEIGKGKGALQMMTLDHLPLRDLPLEVLLFFSSQRWHAAAAGNAALGSRFGDR